MLPSRMMNETADFQDFAIDLIDFFINRNDLEIA